MTRMLTIIALLFATPVLAKPNDLDYGDGGTSFLGILFLLVILIACVYEYAKSSQKLQQDIEIKKKDSELREKQEEIEALQAEARQSKKGKDASADDDDCVFPF